MGAAPDRRADEVRRAPGRKFRPAAGRAGGRGERSTGATATRLGLTLSAIDNTLYDAYGQRQVSTIYNALNQYHVVMEVAPRYWQDPSTLRDVCGSPTRGAILRERSRPTRALLNYAAATAATSTAASIAADAARNLATNALAASGHSSASTGSAVSTSVETMIPFSAFAKWGEGHTPLGVNHQGQFPAVTISFGLAPGKTIRDAQNEIDAAIGDIGMPSSVRGAFAGTAATSQQAQSGQLVPDRRGAARGVPRAGNPLRELHPSHHDHINSAFGQRRRPDGAGNCLTRNSRSSRSSGSSC